MVFFNYATKEITAKIVYYGPGLSGKTTNLQGIYSHLPGDDKGRMISLATSDDRTLFFDFLPLELGTIRSMRTRIQLYTVPGQVFYNTTRKLVLKGADGVVFVADSQEEMMDHNIESFGNLEKNLKEHGMDLKTIPHIVQYNKRDLPNIISVEELNKKLNKYNVVHFEATAIKGIGVYECLREIIRQVITKVAKEYGEKAVEGPVTIPTPKAKAKQEVPVIISPTEPKEEVPFPPSVLQQEAAKKPAMGFPAEAKEEVFGSTAQLKEEEPFLSPEAHIENETEEEWINELQAGDLEHPPPDKEPPFIQAIGESESPFRPPKKREDAFAKNSSLDFQQEYILEEQQVTEEEVNVPLEVTIDKDSKVINLKINLNIKIKRE